MTTSEKLCDAVESGCTCYTVLVQKAVEMRQNAKVRN